MPREHHLLTDSQQKRAVALNAMIARGEMPTMNELRDTRSVLACGCPESLLRSVIAKNAMLTRERTACAEIRSGTAPVVKREFLFPSIADMRRKEDRERRKAEARRDAAHRERFNKLILSL
jgi:hypothetical protein